MVDEDEIPMNMRLMATGAVGVVVLGVIGVQYTTIQVLRQDKAELSASVALLQQTNAQQVLDLAAAELRLVESQAALERERTIYAERETTQKQIFRQLNQQLDRLREVSHGEEAQCMRVRMPVHALSLLREDTDHHSHQNGREEDVSAPSVAGGLSSR